MYSKNDSVPPGANSVVSVGEDPFHVGHGKVVQRKPGDDQVVALVGRQVFHGAVQHAGGAGYRLKCRLDGKTALELLDERAIEFHQVDAVAGSHGGEDLSGDGAGARSDLEDPARGKGDRSNLRGTAQIGCFAQIGPVPFPPGWRHVRPTNRLRAAARNRPLGKMAPVV